MDKARKEMLAEASSNYTESIFESIKHVNEYGVEFWYARELQTALEYKPVSYTHLDVYKRQYTNHTIMAEALEKWPIDLFSRLLPRIYQIIQEIDRRFIIQVEEMYPGNEDKKRTMGILRDGQVRMANLDVYKRQLLYWHLVNYIPYIIIFHEKEKSL